MKYEWRDRDLYQERRVLWLDDVAPGQYTLGIALDAAPLVDEQTTELLPGGVVMLDVPVWVLPAAQKDSSAAVEGGIVVHIPATQENAE
jgi:hypothetical protein